MKILLTNVIGLNSSTPADIEVNADLSRPDLVLEQIIETKGVDFVLNAIGEDEILKHINKALAA